MRVRGGAEERSRGDWVTGEDKVMGGRRRAGQEDKDQEGKPQVRTDGHSTGEGVRARRVHD